MNLSGKWTNGFIWFLIISVITGFWIFAYNFSYNFPFYDDFENILLFILNYSKTESSVSKISFLLKQNFEHRVVFAKLLTVLLYYVTGQINFQWLIILGDLSLLGILYLFYQFYIRKQTSLITCFTITCLLFQVQHYEDSISWATCSLQHAPCIFFSLSCFYVALYKRSVYLSSILVLLALLTSANGLFAIIVWLILIFVQCRNWKQIFFPSVFVISVTLLHLLTLKIHSGSLFEHITSNFSAKFILLLSFAGQIADSNLTSEIYSSLVFGSLFLFPFIIVFIKILRGKSAELSQLQWFCICGSSVLLFTAFLIVFARGSEPDFTGYRMDRYKIYASLISVLAIGFYEPYLSLFQTGVLARYLFAITAFLFCISSYYIYFGSILHYKRTIEANKINFKWNNTILYPNIYADAAARNYLAIAQKSIFRPVKHIIEKDLNEINWESVKDSISIEKEENASSIKINSKNLMIEKDNGKEYEALYVVAVQQYDNNPRYLFTVITAYQRSMKQFYTTCKRSPSSHFSCDIFKNKIKPGAYNLYLIAVMDGRIIKNYRFGKMLV